MRMEQFQRKRVNLLNCGQPVTVNGKGSAGLAGGVVQAKKEGQKKVTGGTRNREMSM
jgi:hypothetical protein